MEANNEPTRADDPHMILLTKVDKLIKESGFPPETQMAVLLNAAVLACSRIPGTLAMRGKTVNAATDEFRKRLQKFLPFGTPVRFPIAQREADDAPRP